MLFLQSRTIRGQVLGEVCDDIALHPNPGGIPGGTGGGRRIDAGSVVDEVGGKAAFPQLLLGEVSGELMDNGADHLQVSQFLCPYRRVKMAPIF